MLGAKDQLLVDKEILKNCKGRMTNLSMAWTDYKKAYDMVPHSWILKWLEMVRGAKNMITIISNSMANWKMVLTSGGTDLGQVDIRRGIFPRRLPITIAICFNHAATDPSSTKDESWIQICKEHEARQPPTVNG